MFSRLRAEISNTACDALFDGGGGGGGGGGGRDCGGDGDDCDHPWHVYEWSMGPANAIISDVDVVAGWQALLLELQL